MPKSFNECVKRGGRVRTVSLLKGKYKHVCYKDGKAYSGHTKTKGSKLADAIKERM